MDKIRNIKRRIIAVFFAFIALFHFRNNGEGFSLEKVITALASPFAIFSSCKTDTDEPPVNKPPVAVAGVSGGTLVDGRYEFDFTSPDNRTIQLNSNGSSDTDGTIEYAWTCTDKPDEADMPTFDSTAPNPTVSGFNKLGNYEFTLKVTDNDGEESEAAVVKVSLVRIASAEITIPTATFNVPVTELDFSVNYGIIDPFFAGRITYKISDGARTIADTFVDPTFNGKVFSRNEYDGEFTTFTQTFYYNGNEISGKSRNLTAVACGPTFIALFENGSPASSVTVAGLSISLSEKVSEGNIQ